MKYILNHIKYLEEFLSDSDNFKKYLPEIRKNIQNRETKNLAGHELKILKETDSLFGQLPDEISDNAPIEEIQKKLDSLSMVDFFIASLIKVVVLYWSLKLIETSSNHITCFFKRLSNKYGFSEYTNGNSDDIDRQQKSRGLLYGDDDDWNYLSTFQKTNISQINYLNGKEKNAFKTLIEIYDRLKGEQKSLSALVFDISKHIEEIVTFGNEKLIERLDIKFSEIKPMYPPPDPEPDWLSRFPLFKKNIDHYRKVIIEHENRQFKNSMIGELNKGFPWTDLKINLERVDNIGISREHSKVFDEIEKLSKMLSQGENKRSDLIKLREIFLKGACFQDAEVGSDALLLKELKLNADQFNKEELKTFKYWDRASDAFKNILTASYDCFEYDACEKELIKNPREVTIDERKFPVLYSIRMVLLSPTLDQLHKKNMQLGKISKENISAGLRRNIQEHFKSLLDDDIKNKKIKTIISDWDDIPQIWLNLESEKRIELLKVVLAFNENEIVFLTLIQKVPPGMEGEVVKFLAPQVYQRINISELSSFDEYNIKKLILFYAPYVNFLKDKLPIDHFIEFSIRISFFGGDCLEDLRKKLAGGLKRSIIRIIHIVSEGISDKETFALSLEYIADNNRVAAKKLLASSIADKKLHEFIKKEIRSAHSSGYLRKLIGFMEHADIELKEEDWPIAIIEKNSAAIGKTSEIYKEDIIPWLNGRKFCIPALRKILELNISGDERWFIRKQMPQEGGLISYVNGQYEKLIGHVPEAKIFLSYGGKNKELNARALKRLTKRLYALSSSYCRKRGNVGGDSRIIVNLFHFIQKKYSHLIRHRDALHGWESLIGGGDGKNIDRIFNDPPMDPSWLKDYHKWIKIRKSELGNDNFESEDNVYKIFFPAEAIGSARKNLERDDKILGALEEYCNITNELNGIKWFGSQFRSVGDQKKINCYQNKIAMTAADIKKIIDA